MTDFNLGLLGAFLVVFGLPLILATGYDIGNHLTRGEKSRSARLKEKLRSHWKRYSVRILVIGLSDAWSEFALVNKGWGLFPSGMTIISQIFEKVYLAIEPFLYPVAWIVGDWIVVVVSLTLLSFLMTSSS